MKHLTLTITMLFLLLGCTTETAKLPTLKSKNELEAAIGQKVMIQGITLNTKPSAALRIDDINIYIPHWPAWQENQLNKTLTVEGQLSKQPATSENNQPSKNNDLIPQSSLQTQPRWILSNPKIVNNN
ncbi:hypothetical protein JD969_04415 [Planctomycetota bacterium]|nr:hypothetical protein JD969_04415 [Planctomycetota bacterium]